MWAGYAFIRERAGLEMCRACIGEAAARLAASEDSREGSALLRDTADLMRLMAEHDLTPEQALALIDATSSHGLWRREVKP